MQYAITFDPIDHLHCYCFILSKLSYPVFYYTEFNNHRSNHAQSEEVATDYAGYAVIHSVDEKKGAWLDGWSIRNATV